MSKKAITEEELWKDHRRTEVPKLRKKSHTEPDVNKFLHSLVALAIKTTSQILRDLKREINTFGRDALWREKRIKSSTKKISSEPSQSVQPPPSPPLYKETISSEGATTSTVGSNFNKDIRFRNWTLIALFAYNFVLGLLIIILRAALPTFVITPSLFILVFVIFFCAVCALIAWNYMSTFIGTCFYVAMFLCIVFIEVLVSMPLKYGTVIACTVVLEFVIIVSIFVSLSHHDKYMRRGHEIFCHSFIIFFVLILGVLFCTSKTAGPATSALIYFVAALACGFEFHYTIHNFVWYTELGYEKLNYWTAGILGFGCLAFRTSLLLYLLHGLFSSMSQYGLGICIALPFNDTPYCPALPASTFALF